MENDGVMIGQGSPEMRFLQFGTDIKVFLVPGHFDFRLQIRLFGGIAGDVYELTAPGARFQQLSSSVPSTVTGEYVITAS